MVNKKGLIEEARETAVHFHDFKADWFANQYTHSTNYYLTSFLYGREQINKYFFTITKELPFEARVLDVGCGTGEMMKFLASQGFDAYGVEPSEKMRNHARKFFSPSRVLDNSILSLPFQDNSFDFVFAIEVLRYLTTEDNLQAFKEVNRVLKPGGIFLGTFVNLFSLDLFFLLIQLRKLRAKFSNKQLSYHTEFETPYGLQKKLYQNDFSHVELHGRMIGLLRLLYKIWQPLGAFCGKLIQSVDPILADNWLGRSFAGHLIAVARK